ncbi:MAG TPA: hypothetical protein VF757_10105 [Sphingomicrobium sp.]
MSENGYTAAELDEAQDRFGVRFPPDLYDLLCKQRIADGYDWTGPADPIERALRWPLEGLLFDVEEAGLWWPEWGARPSNKEDRAALLSEVVNAAPKLIPLLAHRYLPEQPQEAGNPVFSVYQSDIIIYGADLEDWLRVESDQTYTARPQPSRRPIDFWSLAVERSGDPEFMSPL